MAAVSPPRKPLFQSASRDDTFLTCSQLYAAKYLWKMVDPGNDGSRRGSVTHEVLELLLKPRHHKRYSAALHCGTCADVPPLWRLIRRFAARYKVDDPANLKQIDGFIMVALLHDFFGPAGTKTTVGEQEFSLVVDRPEDGIRYAVRGYMDVTHVGEDEMGMWLVCRDMKTSKQKFDADKVEYNLQSLIYQLALRHLYPQITRRSFHFLFLKFVRAPYQDQPPIDEDHLNGFEVILTEMQKALEQFTLANASDNLAAFNQDKRWLCGKEGLKKDGTPAFICSARNPLDYWVLLDEEGNAVDSALTEEELKPREGQVVVSRSYPGCVAFWKDGHRVNFSA